MIGRKRATVELFEEIRREYEFGVGTIKGVARKLGVHRRLVREALTIAMPRSKKQPERKRPALGPAVDFIDRILGEDERAPRKQRHTAHRIYTRIMAELPGCSVSEASVRRYVRKRKHELGLAKRETYVPQSYAWGVEAQVDWYEAWADLDGERRKVNVFAMRSMASGSAFHCAFERATQQSFLEAHERAFDYFGGVFRRLRYDNLTSAVKKILRGFRREESARFIAFRSHWRYQSDFCTPAEAHEKGGVEGEAGYFRRNHLVPVPKARDLTELNEQLLAACRADEARCIYGREQTVGAAMLIEREHLQPLAEEGFQLAEVSFPIVDGFGCARLRTNSYSVPAASGSQVEARVYASFIEFWQEGARIARHERCYGKRQQILDLEHYLDVLERKPGALAGSKPLEQWRRAGRWPRSFDLLWQELIQRHGKQHGTRHMIQVIGLGKQFGYETLSNTVGECLRIRCADVEAIRHLLMRDGLKRQDPEPIDIGALMRFETPMPLINDYDRLLTGEALR